MNNTIPKEIADCLKQMKREQDDIFKRIQAGMKVSQDEIDHATGKVVQSCRIVHIAKPTINNESK